MVKVSNARFEVDKFNGKNNFELWKLKMHDLLVQQGLHKALVGKLKKLADVSEEDQEDLAFVLFNIVREETTIVF